MDKSTNSMVIFNSYVSHYQRVYVGTSNLGSSFAVLRFDQFLLTDPDRVFFGKPKAGTATREVDQETYPLVI